MLGLTPGRTTTEYRLALYTLAAGALLLLVACALAFLRHPWQAVASFLLAGAGLMVGALVGYALSRARVKGQVGAARVPSHTRGI